MLLSLGHISAHSLEKAPPKPLKLGFNIQIGKVTAAKMQEAKLAGIDYLEVSFGEFVDEKRNFKIPEAEIVEKVKQAKLAADQAGIRIWSVHMPFGQHIDLSLGNEAERLQVVALQRKVLQFCALLKLEIVLFHPSWHLGPNERELRKQQLVKSVNELNPAVKKLGAKMVIENMLGFEMVVNKTRERALCRTVEETVEIMNRLPSSVYSAIDMNHIKDPELLIRAMGKRLKSVHIADGNGKQENHFFPCSGEGSNNWKEILRALNEVGYKGPFMYESKYKNLNELKPCYETLYKNAFL